MAPELERPGRDLPGGGTCRHVVNEASLQGPRLDAEAERRETVDDPRQAQMIVIARVQPDLSADVEAPGVDLDAPGVPSQTIEGEHAFERPPEARSQRVRALERANRGVGHERRERIDAARLARREQPLDVVVHSLEAVVVPAEDLVERSPFGVAAAGKELDDRVGSRDGHQASTPLCTESALSAPGGPKARALTVADAARWADIVLLAVPWRTPEALPPAETVAGKIVIDATNPSMKDGTIADLGASSPDVFRVVGVFRGYHNPYQHECWYTRPYG
jgi:hypothetical protein